MPIQYNAYITQLYKFIAVYGNFSSQLTPNATTTISTTKCTFKQAEAGMSEKKYIFIFEVLFFWKILISIISQ